MANPREVFRFIRRSGRRVGITVAGFVVLLGGIVLSAPGVPGPGILLVLAGLSILAHEYTWARRALDAVKARARKVRDRMRRNKGESPPPPTP